MSNAPLYVLIQFVYWIGLEVVVYTELQCISVNIETEIVLFKAVAESLSILVGGTIAQITEPCNQINLVRCCKLYTRTETNTKRTAFRVRTKRSELDATVYEERSNAALSESITSVGSNSEYRCGNFTSTFFFHCLLASISQLNTYSPFLVKFVTNFRYDCESRQAAGVLVSL